MARKYKVTPKGKLLWPHLTQPDTKFKADGVYHTKLVLTAKEAKPIIQEIDAVAAQALEDAKKEVAGMPSKNGKKPKAKPCEDKAYSTNDDGMVEISFKMNATGKNRKGEEYTQSPTLFDSNNKPITDTTIKIGGGTVAKISYEAVPFFTVKIGAGCSLRLKAVQIISLVEWGGDGTYYGFGEEEGDFSASDDEDESDDAEDESETEESDDDEDSDDSTDDSEEEEEEEEPAPVKPKASPNGAKKSAAKKAAPVAAKKGAAVKSKKQADDDDEDF